jgi:hypothetical protein
MSSKMVVSGPFSVCNPTLTTPFSLTLVQVGLVEVVRPRDVHVVQACDVPVATEMLQQLDLAQGTLGQNLLGEDIGNFLDRDAFSSLVVACGAHDTVRALTQLFCDGVALIDNEILVEDLEDLAAGKRRVTHGGRFFVGLRRRIVEGGREDLRAARQDSSAGLMS